jgi:hypothetical protein
MTTIINGSSPSITFSDNTVQSTAGLPLTSAGLGMNSQTWQNVTSSRALGSTYTNSTGYPIMVSVSASGNGGFINAILTALVNGVIIQTNGSNSGTSGGTAYPSVSFIVPNGATYGSNSGGGATLSTWFELR